MTIIRTTSNVRFEDDSAAGDSLDESSLNEDEVSQSSQDEDDDRDDSQELPPPRSSTPRPQEETRSNSSTLVPHMPHERITPPTLPKGRSSGAAQKGASSRPSSRKRKPNPQVDPLEQTICDFIKSSSKDDARQEDDEDDHYGKSIALRLKRLPKMARARARLNIEQALFDAEASAADHTNAQSLSQVHVQDNVNGNASVRLPHHGAHTTSDLYAQSSSVIFGNL